jgi:blue copper oxidase
MVVTVASLLLISGGLVAAAAWIWSRAAVSTADAVEFAKPLPMPPLAGSRIDPEGRRVFDLRVTEGHHDFGRSGWSAVTYGFNGPYLGPTLRAGRGETVVINVQNGLSETSTVHWHGMHLPAIMDGGPHQPIGPGDTWSATWRIDQPAATLWYHAHPHGRTEQHVYRGLAGMFIVDDDETVDLPAEYGVDDIPVIIQDKRFGRDGELDPRRTLLSDVGILGSTVVVNGTVGPYLLATTERLRLRLLNGSTARTYDLGFTDGRSFALVGSDGGFLAAPHRIDRIMLSPGERAEIVVDLRPGEEAILRSYPPPLGVEHPGGRFDGRDDTLDILQLRAADQLAPRVEVPRELVRVPRFDPAEAVVVREFTLNGHEINGERMNLGRIDFAVGAGSIEIWRVVNADGDPHNFHIHDVQFQVLTVDGDPPPAQLAGWKDTVYLPPGVPFEIIARFSAYPDPEVPYMFHCHLLWHEDEGMMGQYVVTAAE